MMRVCKLPVEGRRRRQEGEAGNLRNQGGKVAVAGRRRRLTAAVGYSD